MIDDCRLGKRIFVHIGPHKTGSTAIQRCLAENKATLAEAGLKYLHSKTLHDAGMLLAKESFQEAEQLLIRVARKISTSEAGTWLLSQEDFCGDLPGRSRRKAVYPKLAKNLRIIVRALSPHQVVFVFFERDEEQWLESCYHQHLRFRTFFNDFRTFRSHFENFTDWESQLQGVKSIFGDSLRIIPYVKVPHAGASALLSAAGFGDLVLANLPKIENSSPCPEKIRLLERINLFSSFKATAWFSKNLILRDWTPRKPYDVPPRTEDRSDSLASISLPDLATRAAARISVQNSDDILPDREVDLRGYLFDKIPISIEPHDRPRADIRDQSRILDYHLRGKSQLSKLNALTISYLRRDTEHTDKAKHLFHRIWEEHGVLLVNEISTRWLISTLQTFLDHGRNEAQRMIGACGYFYGNMMKIYEGERAIEGLDQDGVYAGNRPQTANKFLGLDRYELGGTDLLLNTNALALDISMRDDVAGIVLQELLLRTKQSGNVFTRSDKSRQLHGINVEGFGDTWSFFDVPRALGFSEAELAGHLV